MDREALGGLLDELDAVHAKLASFDYAALAGRDLVMIAERREHARRRDAALDHTVYAALADRYMPEDYGGTSVKDVLAERLHLDTGDIAKRLKDAEQLGPRWTLTGQVLPPALAHTAAGLAGGELAPEHVGKIIEALTKPPAWVDASSREQAEHDLAHLGAGLRPADVRALGNSSAH
jgi:phosphoribosylanthranilate isomerase